MLEMAVAGGEEFLLGFQLAGISKVFKIEKNSEEQIKKFTENKEIGILVLDDAVMKSLPDHVQTDLNKMVKPVVVVLSKEAGSTSLRNSIIKAIGVDLMKEK